MREHGPCDESEAGTRGDEWHEDAIRRALTGAGWHVTELALQSTDDFLLRTELADGGSFLVFGVTNNQWSRRSSKIGYQVQPLKYPDEPADGPVHSPDDWKHTVAVVDGAMHDGAVCMRLTRHHPFWLRANNQPDAVNGWLRSIGKVWRLSAGGDFPSGAERPIGAKRKTSAETAELGPQDAKRGRAGEGDDGALDVDLALILRALSGVLCRTYDPDDVTSTRTLASVYTRQPRQALSHLSAQIATLDDAFEVEWFEIDEYDMLPAGVVVCSCTDRIDSFTLAAQVVPKGVFVTSTHIGFTVRPCLPLL